MTGRCLYRYLLTRWRKELGDETEPMKVGRLVHDAIEHYAKACMEAKVESDAGLMEAAIGDALGKHPIDLTAYPEVRESLLSFAEKGIEVEKMLKAESAFRIEIAGGGILEGRIDRVNAYKSVDGRSILEIIDYKNTRKMQSLGEVRGDIQLALYRYAANRHLFPGFDMVRTGIYNTRYGVMRWDGEPVPVLDFAKQDDGIEAYLAAQWERLHETPEKDMEPEPGPQCWEYGGCPVRIAGECPMFSAAARKKATAIDDRVRAARALRDELAAIIDRLKVELQEVEAIEVDGEIVGYKAAETESYPLPGVLEIPGLDLAGVTLSKTEIQKCAGGKKALERDAEMGSALAAIAERGVRTTFTY